MKKFEHELEALLASLNEMAQLARSMVSLSTSGLADRADDHSAELADLEEAVDHLQITIDKEAVRLLTVYSPVAGDLRFVLSVSHVNSALERLGDQAVNLHRDLDLIPADCSFETPGFQEMVRLVKQMIDDSLQAFNGRDAALAEATLQHDDAVDELNKKVIAKLLSDHAIRRSLSNPGSTGNALAQLLVSRSLERMADMAAHVCEQVVFMVKGDDIRHRHEEDPEVAS